MANNKPNQKVFVKGKKALAQVRASQDSSLGIVEGELCTFSCAGQLDKRSFRLADEQATRGRDPKLESNEGSSPRTILELQITNTLRPEMGFKFKGSCNGDSGGGARQDLCQSILGHGVDKQRASKSIEVDFPID